MNTCRSNCISLHRFTFKEDIKLSENYTGEDVYGIIYIVLLGAQGSKSSENNIIIMFFFLLFSLCLLSVFISVDVYFIPTN